MSEIGTGAAIFGCAGPELLAKERGFFRDFDPFGFIIFARNVETPDQLRRLTGDLRDAVGREAPILIDQESGRVQRMRAPHWRDWQPPFGTVAQIGDPAKAARAMYLRMRIIAAELRDVGIDANCAPVADVARAATHPFLLNRCYGSDALSVAQIGRAVADGLQAGGVWPVVKHMPGHGLSSMDTHLELPTVTASAEELRSVDFAPFAALKDLPMAMTAHIIFAAFDSLPATQSPTMIRLIREEIGFSGLLMTDDLNMEALKGNLASRTAASLAAGCDIALHCKGDFAQMEEVAAAAGAMRADSQARARAALASRQAPQPFDLAAAEAELAALTSEAAHG
ncbi:glycoside hydrolase family 3 N-terminal domain-containing protein [Xinfangfangia sp. CPCC 101601]|uniref:beta-N-acetylhexosaminidase n=1 Tax=Pseudogemmobacter lacusdianii TaxID=3069608 RepID=A0ABU0VWE5_9RHOB|nr:glycoside hydrolase family 3 N-terminal domain-containing protein [Xinfangfangia sp. CPCC 101601]MDQ2065515.1 glycoside hydrolase family 3 N-terminal domain-containing protein [Xinfangfangia sp. CPCC 101601]